MSVGIRSPEDGQISCEIGSWAVVAYTELVDFWQNLKHSWRAFRDLGKLPLYLVALFSKGTSDSACSTQQEGLHTSLIPPRKTQVLGETKPWKLKARPNPPAGAWRLGDWLHFYSLFIGFSLVLCISTAH